MSDALFFVAWPIQNKKPAQQIALAAENNMTAADVSPSKTPIYMAIRRANKSKN
ncbi:hypothetical protein D3C85_1800820 [compost metagenome]